MESSYSSREFSTAVLALIFIFISYGRCNDNGNSTTTKNPLRSETIHLYLLAVPESSLPNIQRFRQEDEDGGGGGGGFNAETGQHLGMIIQGVLGGDFRPIFAGSLKFVEEPMAQQNLGSFLGTIAPALNLAFRELYNRAQAAFGFGATTPKPTQAAPQASTVPPMKQPTLQEIIDGSANSTVINSSNYVLVEEGGANKNVSIYLGPELVNEQTKVKPQNKPQPEQQTEKMQPPTTTTSWQYVLNQIQSETTTVPPLPLLNRFPTGGVDGEDGDDYDGRRN